MNAKEIIKILIQADIIEQESDIETTYTQKREWIAKKILSKSKEEGLQKHSDNIELLVAYTNWLSGEGYVDSDVYAEKPTAVDSFLTVFGKGEDR